jgi:hypothetical protein
LRKRPRSRRLHRRCRAAEWISKQRRRFVFTNDKIFETGRTLRPVLLWHAEARDIVDKAQTAAVSYDLRRTVMNKPIAVFVGALICALASSPVFSEQKAQPKAKGPTGPQIRYFDLSSDVFTDLGAEVILKERRQGTALVNAELDVCHAAAPGSYRLDRFVVPLKLEGNRLVGSAQSQELKRPVAVSLTRRVAGGNFNNEGSIKSGTYSEDIQSLGNNEMTEQEFTESYAVEDEIEAAPSDFTQGSPQALAIRVARGQLAGLLNALRDQNVRIVFSGLYLTCRVLKTGQYVVQLDVDPERAGAVLGKVKGLPGVDAAGYGPANHNWDRAIRFPSAGWREGGKLNRDKFSKAVGDTIAKVMAAAVGSAAWDDRTGLLTITLRRSDEAVAGLKLTEVLTVVVLVAPESPSSNQQSLLWIEKLGSRVVDEAAGAKLEFLASDDEGAEPEGSEGIMPALAAELKGQIWDSENEDWQ